MVRKAISVLGFVAICSLILGSVVQAQPKVYPFALNATVQSTGKVALSWTKPPGDSVAYYLVYRASLPNALTYSKIDSTTGNDFTDSPSLNSIPPVYFYYVDAKMKKGATLRSNPATVNLEGIPHGDVVHILSEPVKTGRVAVEYIYQVKAESSDSTAKLHYDLAFHPSGMTIDSVGLIKWLPASRGLFEVRINVTSNKGGKASQEYFITVTGPTGTIAGVVTDTTGKPIPKVTIHIYGRDKTDHFEYGAVTDSLGKYTIPKVDLGTYVARAVPMKGDFLAQWYNGVTSEAMATPIDVKDSVVVQVNFMLRAKATIPTFLVSGTVQDTSKKPVKGAPVVFVVSSFAFNSARPDPDDWSSDGDERDLFDSGQASAFAMGLAGGMPGMAAPPMAVVDDGFLDFRIDGNSVFVFKTKTDSLGHYSIKLPGGSYIAEVTAAGYYRLFYNNKTDFLMADMIKVAADISDINFDLKPISPLAYGKINGSVIDSTTRGGVVSRVIAFRILVNGKDTLIVPRTYMADTDSLGAYSIDHVPPGDYIILALPLGHYVPSFYSVSGATRRWQEATKVNVNGNTVAGINIFVVPMLKSGAGFTSIRGNVSSTSMASIAGGLVYATDNTTGEVTGYGVTNSDGSFIVGELAPGSYTVTADMIDYSTSSTTANPSYDPVTGAAVVSTVSLTLNAVVTSISQDPVSVPVSYALSQNYPNPFNPTTQILFSLPRSEKVSLIIYNLLGQRVATLVEESLAAGTHVVTWNGRDEQSRELPSGVYFYSLKTGDFTATKKMVMLK